MRGRSLLLAFVLLTPSLYADPARWPNGGQFDRLAQIGSGVAVIFSPDLAQPGNRRFYERLGFAYFEDPSWTAVLQQLRQRTFTGERIEFVLLETHGTNGHGLKLQAGEESRAGRSYISMGALQEALDQIGVQRCYLTACNAGRLLRPEIYKSLNRRVDDPLFLPATLGIVDASPDYDPRQSKVQILRRKQSNLETLIHGDSSEFAPAVRELFDERSGDTPFRFVISTMLIQLILNDPRVELTSSGHVRKLSESDIPDQESEKLFQHFLELLAEVGACELSDRQAQLRAHPAERARSR